MSQLNFRKNTVSIIPETRRNSEGKELISLSNIVRSGANDLIQQKIVDVAMKSLMSGKNVEIIKKDDRLKMKQITSSKSVVVEVRNYGDTSFGILAQTKRNRPISQMGGTISKLRRDGMTQTQVADILGTTQANISKIEAAMKKTK